MKHEKAGHQTIGKNDFLRFSIVNIGCGVYPRIQPIWQTTNMTLRFFILFLSASLVLPALGRTGEACGTLNSLAGGEIFLEDGGLDISERGLVMRGGWVKESSHDGKNSFRQYPMGQKNSLGASTFSRSAVFLDGKLINLVVVFSNRGDSPERGAKLNVAIRQDYSSVEKGLVSILGTGAPHVDKSGGINESGRKWTHKNVDIFLTQQPEAYVRLRFAPVGTGGGGEGRVRDAVARRENHEKIQRRENGDVILTDFPMIDQGSKGYCVPASWARVLQFMGVDADMYSLGAASLSDTGGTDIEKATTIGMEVARSGGRRVSLPNLKPTIREVSLYVDKGIPLLWGMLYSDEFFNTGSVSSGQAGRPERGLRRARGQPHVCVIVGYNQKTGEVAVSDSWGMAFRERWYSIANVQNVSLGKFCAVEY